MIDIENKYVGFYKHLNLIANVCPFSSSSHAGQAPPNNVYVITDQPTGHGQGPHNGMHQQHEKKSSGRECAETICCCVAGYCIIESCCNLLGCLCSICLEC